ncbi:selenocysteine-specific translation elongation factor [Heliorestis acidaminivorans]|uniref:Selenocysteine-specific elongation factor n=1 Tax=Heliorestis acidaminivorans TaxID=553427 RepID=A0A6I0ETE5_9FIRM|nr:selenocysteine-specific translation elongation factor [Heliorestis acidaminivorans]KAB2953905.1 selenocysteine-specific translation elongation factor [Heliorestis acidaminivorans]
MTRAEDIHVIIGTAGHVDHGKTKLVNALTGVHTDRLKEEKARGISIELGFAPFVLPDGKKAAIVDVPGHEKFVKQMVAGAVGMDLVLLVIAADEGVMPQTKEHLDVLELLQVPQGIIVITKADLVEEEWLDLIVEEVKETLQGTLFEQAPVVTLSSTTGQGIDSLKAMIAAQVTKIPRRLLAGAPRLPIDRVFTMAGFGTVVTGTLLSGQLQVGQQLTIMPSEQPCRIRGLQVHSEKVEEARAGQRVAVNLSGIELSDVNRGDLLATAEALTPAYRVTVRLQNLSHSGRTMKDQERVRFHAGTRETLGRLTLLDRHELEPGKDSLAQIVLEEPVVVLKGDRFVLRSYSPALTIGGGRVIDPNALKVRKNKVELLKNIETQEKGSIADRLLQHLSQTGLPLSPDEAIKKFTLSKEELEKLLEKVQDHKTPGIALLGREKPPIYFISAALLVSLEQSFVRHLEKYHQDYPLRSGMAKEELKGKLLSAWNSKAYGALLQTLQERQSIAIKGHALALYNFGNEPSAEVRAIIKKIEKWYLEKEFQPPTVAETKEKLITEEKVSPESADEIMNYMIDQGLLFKLAEDLRIHSQAMKRFREIVIQGLQEQAEMTISEVRDLTDSSRRYVVPLMEWLDRERVTIRKGDKRVLAKG